MNVWITEPTRQCISGSGCDCCAVVVCYVKMKVYSRVEMKSVFSCVKISHNGVGL